MTTSPPAPDRRFPRIPLPWLDRPPVVSVVRLSGVIGVGGGPFGRALSLAGLAGVLERAFHAKRLAAVALAINSPGGSPVQSALIARRIRDLADEKKVPVLAFCEDAAASGGYWLAAAADEIYADPASVVGSIGVISQGFGFQDLIARHGVERRVHTAGDKKSLLDPFQPETADGLERLNTLLADIHAEFKDYVRQRRGDRLKGTDEELFSGAFWTGRRALGLGLIDGFGHLRPVLRARFGDRVRLRVTGERRGWLQRLWPRGGGWQYPLASALTDAMMTAVEERALWARYGL
jgi:signal peptide peptidase SppA